MNYIYFHQAGLYQDLLDRLVVLFPESGPVNLCKQYVAHEKLRQALHCYYDLHNNGLANKAREAHRIFGFGSQPFKIAEGRFDRVYMDRVELRMNDLILAAAHERGWIDA